jgi:hypothetical protein
MIKLKGFLGILPEKRDKKRRVPKKFLGTQGQRPFSRVKYIP